MNNEYIKKIAELWQQVAEKKALDPVNPNALKGKHSGRMDKDIDNDGDVDSSDKYLHNRRKAISKAMKNESDDEMKPCPKCDGSMQNHDPDCPMADDDDDMENESSCGSKRMKKEDVDLDEAKSKEQQIDDLEKMLNRISGNTSSVKMKRYAIQKKIDGLKKESVELDEKVNTDKGRKELLKIVEHVSNAISAHNRIGSDAEKLLDAIPNGVKDYRALYRSLSEAKKAADSLGSNLRNAQRWDAKLLESYNKEESVSHEKWGYGEVIEATEDGYNVYFEHGVEFNVSEDELSFLEGKNYAERTKGATKPEMMKDKLKGKGAKDMAADADMDNPELAADDAKGHEDATKAGRAVNTQAPTRGGEKRVGDKSIVNPAKGAVTKTTGKEG